MKKQKRTSTQKYGALKRRIFETVATENKI